MGSGDITPVTGKSAKVSIKAGETATLEVVQIYTHAQTPFPELYVKSGRKVQWEWEYQRQLTASLPIWKTKRRGLRADNKGRTCSLFSKPSLSPPSHLSLSQEETQLVRFSASLHVPTAYQTETQSTILTLAGKAESYTKVKPYRADGTKLTYGPYKNVAAGSEEELKVHFENTTPFLTATTYEREIMVSHWGYSSITETTELVHSGGKLKVRAGDGGPQRRRLKINTEEQNVRAQLKTCAVPLLTPRCTPPSIYFLGCLFAPRLPAQPAGAQEWH